MIKNQALKYFQTFSSEDITSPLHDIYFKNDSLYACNAIVLVKMQWKEQLYKNDKTYVIDQAKLNGVSKVNKANLVGIKRYLVPSEVEMPDFDLWFTGRIANERREQCFIDPKIFREVAHLFATSWFQIQVVDDREDTLFLRGIQYTRDKPYAELSAIIAKKVIAYA